MATARTPRQKAEAMRARGSSYREIVAATGVSKSTLSYWFTGRHERAALAGKTKIYFIQSVNGGPVKIGIANDQYRRLAELQCGNPEELVLRATIEGDDRVERDLHARFAEHRVRGEWFLPSREMEREAGVDLGAENRRIGKQRRAVPLRCVPVVVTLANLGGWLTAAELKRLGVVPEHCAAILRTAKDRGWLISRHVEDDGGQRKLEWAHSGHFTTYDDPTYWQTAGTAHATAHGGTYEQ